jgi:pimeloyl-ACP methyl ester carboxylesterase
MPRTQPVDGFSLAYDRSGTGPAVVLLHGWPGDRGDFRLVTPLLSGAADVVVPDLRGFGESDKHAVDPDEGYSGAAQARSITGLLDELGLGPVVLAGYDIGSRIAQAVAQASPDRVRALVIAPPAPGAGRRVLDPDAQTQFWYQHFHRLPVAAQLLDGRPDAVRSYLRHFWTSWSGPSFSPSDDDLDRLTAGYARPGAFTSSIGWYRAGQGIVARSLAERAPEPADRMRVPTSVLWPGHDPLFPPEWGDRLGDFFTDVTVRPLPEAGHFVPLEAPEAFASAIRAALDGVRAG